MNLCIHLSIVSLLLAFYTSCSITSNITEVNQNRTPSFTSIPQLDFILEENYLIVYTLQRGSADGKNFSTALDFQNYAWALNKAKYREQKKYDNSELDNLHTKKFRDNFDTYFEELKNSIQYKKLYKETVEYKNDCAKEWNKNLNKSFELMKKITKLHFQFPKSVKIYITHPAVSNGSALDRKNFKIAWGDWGHFPNYSTVYLWHEILHSFMDIDDVSHAVIQMATDNELRARLNNTTFPPFVGHESLKPLMDKIYSKWKTYLNSEMNLIDFAKTINDSL